MPRPGTSPAARGWAALAALALAALALPLAAAAAAACPAALTPEQCKVCALSKVPSACHSCVQGAKPSKELVMTAQACMVCASLDAPDQQAACTNCVKTHGYNSGCSACGGAALFNLPDNTKPTAKGLAVAGGCYSCYSKAGTELQATPACVACWAPTSKDPAACSACVAGATGLAPAARGACFGCYLTSQSDPASCTACLKAAPSPAAAALCPLCAKEGAGKVDQGQCYNCMSAVSDKLPGVRWLCHFTGSAKDNKPSKALTSAVPGYFRCLSAAGTLEEGQACRKCMDQIEKSGAKAGDACFAALAG